MSAQQKCEGIEFDDVPPRGERAVWREWLRRHGVDPCDVALPGWIERRPAACQLVYLSYALDENGRPRWDRERREPVYVTRVFQMEAPPLPFPSMP